MVYFCDKCGASLAPGSNFCGSCGARVPQSASSAAAAAAVQAAPEESRRVKTPETIDELLAFCQRHELPLAKMRFFIGLDYPGAKAYGIYRDGNDFVVYKNKADGSRAVRYRGPDEAFAVNEIFQKLKEEATGQRAHKAAAGKVGYPASSAHANNPYNDYSSGAEYRGRSGKRKSNKILIGIIAAAAAITIGRTVAAINQPGTPTTGYYQYNGNTYYSQNDDWYLYDSYGGNWFPIYAVDDELQSNYGDYYSSYSYDEDYGVSSFADSQYYSYSDYSYDSSSSDYDSGSSWDWDWDWDDDDDWDSSDDWDWDSDWDSDWGDWDSDW